MKKFAIAAVAAAIATLSFSTIAEARAHWEHRGWHNSGWNHHGGWNRLWRHDGWRHSGWHHRGYWGGWGGGWGGYWGGPAIVIGGPVYNDYCFVRRVRHHDRHGNVYIKRVRVCR